MSNIRKFQISEQYLWGFNTNIDIDEVESIEEIINIVLNRCENFLRENNLLGLVDYLNDKKNDFHIHNYSFENILMSEPNVEFYVCCH